MIDVHMHFRGSLASLRNAADLLRQAPVDAITLLTLITEESTTASWLQMPAALLFKLDHPGNYAFAALDYDAAAPAFEEQARAAREMGFDGFKLYHGKPTMRRHLGFRLDDHRYDGFYRYVAEAGMPVLHHVGDSVELWDPNACPQWARDFGWCYADPSFVSREQLYREAESVVAQHPEAQIIYPHFYSMADNIDEADRLLTSYSNLHFDLTPGFEIYRHFSGNPAAWRDFFMRHADRILLGTDNYAGRTHPNSDRLSESIAKIGMIRSFLDGSDDPERERRGYATVALPPDVVEQICRGNAQRLLGDSPAQVDVADAIAYAQQLVRHLDDAGDEQGAERGRELIDGLREYADA